MAAFFIDFNHSQYGPGNVVSGTVTCIFDGPQTIEGIEIKFRGEEHTKWSGKPDLDSVNSFSKGVDEEVQYSGYNKFLSRKVTLPGVSFQPGKYDYRFSFQLPRDIPGSYVNQAENEYNCVKYYVKTTIKKAGVVVPMVTIKQFDVISPIDLKDFAKKNQRVEKTDNGLLKVSASLEKNILLVGDEVDLTVTVSNPTKTQVNRITAEVGTNIEAIALEPTKTSRTYYNLIEGQDIVCPDDDSKERYNFRLKIPKNAELPNFNDCKLFKFASVIKVIVIIPTYKNVTVNLPIILGHVITSDASLEPSDSSISEPYVFDIDIFEPLYLDHPFKGHGSNAQDSKPPQDSSEPNSNHNLEPKLPSRTSAEVVHPLDGGHPTPSIPLPNPLILDSPQKFSTDHPTESTPLVTQFPHVEASSNSPNLDEALASVNLHMISTNLLLNSSPPVNVVLPSDGHNANNAICSTEGLWNNHEGLTERPGGGWGSTSNQGDSHGCCDDDGCDCDCDDCDCDCDCGDCDCDCGDANCDCGDCNCDCGDCVIM